MNGVIALVRGPVLAGRGKNAPEQSGTVRLLMRTIIAVKRVVKKPPSCVYQITSGQQNQQSGTFKQEASAVRGGGVWRMRSLQDLQTGCPEGLSGFAQAVKGSHQGIIRQKRHRHSKTPLTDFCSVAGAKGDLLQSASSHVP